MSSQQSRRGNAAPDGRGQLGNDTKGAEAYPYDPTLRLESQRGLDRLRCVPDRALAADFFAIFQAAERNTEEATRAEREQAQRDEAERKRLCSLAARALDGEFGSDELSVPSARIMCTCCSTREGGAQRTSARFASSNAH